MLASLPVVLALGWAYHRLASEELQKSLLKMYALLYRAPGANVISEKKAITLLMVNVVYFAGAICLQMGYNAVTFWSCVLHH